jgi:hypothetical protein
MFLGGRIRNLPRDSTFGVHQFSFKDSSPRDIEHSQTLSAKIAAFVHDMGIGPGFIEISSATTSNGTNILSDDHLRKLGVLTGYQTEAEWTVHASNHTMYVRGERDSTFGHHKVMMCYTKGIGFLFWAVIESQGRENELLGFKLVEIVANGEETRIDISDRCERHVVGIYVNVMATLSEGETQTIAFSESFGVQIRASSEAPVFLGIAAVSTEGGQDQLQTFYNTLCSGP